MTGMLPSGKYAYREQVGGYSTRINSRDGVQHQRSREFSGASASLVVENLYWREYFIFTVRFREAQTQPLTRVFCTSSHVIDYLRMAAPTHVVTFVYFDYQRADTQPQRTLLASVLRQLLRQLWPDVPSACKKWLKNTIKSDKPQLADLEENFFSILSYVENCYIVVDALDESGSPNERAELLTLLTKLADIPSVRLCITSRSGIADIQSVLEGAQRVDVQADRDDLKTCLSTMIDRSSSREWIKTSDRDSIIDNIIERSHGMSVPL